ncbi:MAG: DUF4345 domain-containing protein [Proteobacteria bacterium]|nr:DUF4345 domain-containing protein [Pseudomonadota bacterium]MDA0926467.1 DUF4345 domain-containing protein [Pseudomonadota bacterium]
MEGSRVSKLVRAQLHLNGWVAVLIGSFIVLDPAGMLASYGLQSELSAGLMSELRAPGGLLLVCGLAIVFCSSRPAMVHSGLLLSIMVYGAYGSVRLLAMLIDGLPPVEIQLAAAVEVGLCALSAASLYNVQVRNQLALDGQGDSHDF